MIISHKYKFIFVKTTKVSSTSIESFLSQNCDEIDIVTPLWHPEPGFKARNYRGYFNPIPELLERFKNCGISKDAGYHNTLLDFKSKTKFHEGIPAWQIQCRVDQDIWNSYFKFTIERNPWDKCVSRFYHSKSVYEKKYNRPLTFEAWFEYFEERLRNPGTLKSWGSEAPYNYPRYVDPWTDEILVDTVCRYENRDTELVEVFNSLGIPSTDFQNHRLKTNYRKDKRDYRVFFTKYPQYIGRIESLFQKEIKLLGYSFD